MSSKTSSAKYYQDNKERPQKSLSKEEKDYRKMKYKNCLSIEEKYYKMEKRSIIIIKNYFHLDIFFLRLS